MTDSPVPGKIYNLEKIIRDGDADTLKRSKEHCANNTRQAIEPFQETVTRHDRLLFGQYGDGGLVVDVRDHGNELESHDKRIKTMEDTAKSAWGAVSDLVDELREETARTGRTPRHGTQVEVGHRTTEEDGSTFKFTLPKRLWPLLLVASVGGPSAIASIISLATQAPQAAVTVAAEGVATMQAQAEQELDRARRVTAEAEAKAARLAAEAEAKAAQADREIDRRIRALRERENAAAAPAQAPTEPTTK